MPDWLVNAFANGQELRWEALVLRLGAAFALGCAVAAIYRFTLVRAAEGTSSFIATLVLLAVLIAVVTQVIGNNIARAFSLVGALSIVRFRTVVEDTRDTAFVIFAVVMGMAVGAGYLAVALAGLAAGGLAAVAVRPRQAKPDGGDEWIMTLRIGLGHDPDTMLAPFLAKHFESSRLQSSGTGRQGSALDLSYRVHPRQGGLPNAIVAELNRMEGVQSVELRRA